MSIKSTGASTTVGPIDLATKACVALSRLLLRQPDVSTRSVMDYAAWRDASCRRAWSAFRDEHVEGKDVLDFGCGDGQLAIWLTPKKPASMIGTDVAIEGLARARAGCPPNAAITFLHCAPNRIPLPDQSLDTIIAIDCLEHVMQIDAIVAEWFRVLRPGGSVLIEWFPYTGPWGPHMESLLPIPWAHLLFSERTLFRACAEIYDSPGFVPRHWDLTEDGEKRANKWRQWSSFAEQGFINRLSMRDFRRIALAVGFTAVRWEMHGLSGSRGRQRIGRALMAMPVIGEYFVMYTVVELQRPQ